MIVYVNDKSNIEWYDRFEYYDMEHLIKRVKYYYNREIIYLEKCENGYIIIIDKIK